MSQHGRCAPACVRRPRAQTCLYERPKDATQDLRDDIQAAAAPGAVPREALRKGDHRVQMPVRSHGVVILTSILCCSSVGNRITQYHSDIR